MLSTDYFGYRSLYALGENYAINVREDVNSHWCVSHSNYLILFQKYGDIKFGQVKTKYTEAVNNFFGIGDAPRYPNIHIRRGAWIAMNCNGESAYEEILNAVVVE